MAVGSGRGQEGRGAENGPVTLGLHGGCSGGRLSGGDGARDGRRLAIGRTSIENMWAASKKKHRGEVE